MSTLVRKLETMAVQTERTEVRLMRGTAQRVVHRLERTRSAAHRTGEPMEADALDAAFGEYSRVDAGTQQVSPPRDSRTMTKKLIEDITTQLSVLDRQREQLASLLRDVAV